MFTAKVGIPLPTLPLELEKHISDIAHDNQKPFLMYEAGLGRFECKPIDKQILYWSIKNLPVSLRSICVQTICAGDFDVHVDGPTANGPPRDFNLMYIIEPGGACVTTSFYKTTEDLLEIAGPTRILPPEHREKIDTFEFKPGQWVLMNNQCFHSVNGITELRVGLSISLYKKEVDVHLESFINQ